VSVRGEANFDFSITISETERLASKHDEVNLIVEMLNQPTMVVVLVWFSSVALALKRCILTQILTLWPTT
jgi:hypothetical protein